MIMGLTSARVTTCVAAGASPGHLGSDFTEGVLGILDWPVEASQLTFSQAVEPAWIQFGAIDLSVPTVSGVKNHPLIVRGHVWMRV